MPQIADPHHAVEVAVVDQLAHRSIVSSLPPAEPGGYKIELIQAACNSKKAQPMSFGFASSLGNIPCTATKCYPGQKPQPSSAEPDRLWMSTRRRNLDHHRLRAGATKTGCDRFAGETEDGMLDNGILVSPELIAELGSKPCKRCWPDA